ncbi:hypothetical protein M2283_010173 [Streptomyces pseudovenezuelae]|uniref:Uncharacterized protein n=1 Tax=Streptomyces pseudovenezuelae TaxID=67350 RepID=A0ABT6M4A8_9ACTN|nr:hypothetical protein [Streptomyces pseudovenezuelae]MDH6222821.1 hypothetical protein [Streptomyces pseudovenezuelae]
MDARMTSAADHKGLAMSHGHEICPRRPVYRSAEVCELGDVMDFHLVKASACLASSREKPGDQLLAFDADRGQLTVSDDRLLVLSQRDPAEPPDQWLPAGAFDAGLEALAWPGAVIGGGAQATLAALHVRVARREFGAPPTSWPSPTPGTPPLPSEESLD